MASQIYSDEVVTNKTSEEGSLAAKVVSSCTLVSILGENQTRLKSHVSSLKLNLIEFKWRSEVWQLYNY